VNIGSRQIGRQRGENVIDANYDRKDIVAAIKRSLEPAYRVRLKTLINPWGDGRTGRRVAKILEELEINNGLLAKKITF